MGGVGPHLVLTPVGKTKLEYFTETSSSYAHGGGRYTVFVHSAASGGQERRGTWRQDHTSATLAPGEQLEYRFTFHWADGYEGIRDILYDGGLFDIRVAPGMVIPRDLTARFIVEKHQRTDAEHPYPYGIYGADSWRVNRFAERDPLEGAASRPGGPSQCRMWRTFDYPTYFALYYNMHRIARHHPGLVTYLDAPGYLERAFGTAQAYFEVPYSIP